MGKLSEKASLLKYGEVLWLFRDHPWGEGAVPVQALAVQAPFGRAAPFAARQVKC